jgi:hypothetical protein
MCHVPRETWQSTFAHDNMRKSKGNQTGQVRAGLGVPAFVLSI